MLNKIFWSLLIFLLGSFPVWAGEPESEPLKLDRVLELSLKDLMDIDISIATKRATPASRAPGIVTVITSKQIKQMGYIGRWRMS